MGNKGKNRRSAVRSLSESERKRRKRERILMLVIPVVVGVLTFAEYRLIHFSGNFPATGTILMFCLININLLLLILLIFLVFRNLVKLLYDRKRKVMGSTLRTRLVLSFIAITMLPTSVLFFLSIGFISSSIQLWFTPPVEQALENAPRIGRMFYDHVEQNHLFFYRQIAIQIQRRDLIHSPKQLQSYIQVAQRAFNLDAVEVYAANSQRLAWSCRPELRSDIQRGVSPGHFLENMPKGTRLVTEDFGTGQIVRLIGTFPEGATPGTATSFVVISKVLSPELSRSLETVAKGVEEYRKIKEIKEPIGKTHYITLSIVALLVVFCAIWFGFYLAKSITIPIQELAEGTRRVAEGDLEFRVRLIGSDEIGSLVQSFNKMTRDLKSSREQLEASTRLLARQNTEIEQKRQYLETVLQNISAGVITLDAHGMVTTMNKSIQQMLQLDSQQILNKPFREFLNRQYLHSVLKTLDQLADSKTDALQKTINITIDGRIRNFLVHARSLKDESQIPIGSVLVFDDLTDQEKVQRISAWREVARRVAHEVKNPLTPINLSAQRLKRKYGNRLDEPVFHECIAMIMENVELIRNQVNDFSTFARFPKLNSEPCDLMGLVREVMEPFREKYPNIEFTLTSTDKTMILNLDREQFKQALTRLVASATGAMKGRGGLTILLSRDTDRKMVIMEVADTQNRASDKNEERVLDPEFIRHQSGTQLGLAIVASIIGDHNGGIRIMDNSPHGFRFIIELPIPEK